MRLAPAGSFPFVFLDFVSIIVFYGEDDITFRDFGLTMAALALFTLVYDRSPRKVDK